MAYFGPYGRLESAPMPLAIKIDPLFQIETRNEELKKLVEKRETDITWFKFGRQLGRFRRSYLQNIEMGRKLLKNQRLLRTLEAVDLPLTPSIFREGFVFFSLFSFLILAILTEIVREAVERNRSSLTAVTLRFWIVDDGTGEIDLGNEKSLENGECEKQIILPKEVVEGLESIVNTVKFRPENAKKEMETINKLLTKERRVPLEICNIIHEYVYDYHIFDILRNRGNNVKFGPNKVEYYRECELTNLRGNCAFPNSAPQGVVHIMFTVPWVYNDEKVKASFKHLLEKGEEFHCETLDNWVTVFRFNEFRPRFHKQFEKMISLASNHMDGEPFSFPCDDGDIGENEKDISKVKEAKKEREVVTPSLQVTIREKNSREVREVQRSGGHPSKERSKRGRKRKAPDDEGEHHRG